MHFDNMTIFSTDETDFIMNFDFAANEGAYHVKFLDFGLSNFSDENGFGSTEVTGTPVYSAPE